MIENPQSHAASLLPRKRLRGSNRLVDSQPQVQDYDAQNPEDKPCTAHVEETGDTLLERFDMPSIRERPPYCTAPWPRQTFSATRFQSRLIR